VRVALRVAGLEQASSDVSVASADLIRLHCGGAGTIKSEFKSPLPTEGALNFASYGAAEVASLS